MKAHAMTTGKNIHPHNSISLSHPAHLKYELKSVAFGWPTLLAAACCYLPLRVTLSLQRLFLKIWKISPVGCVQLGGRTQTLPQRGLGGTPLLWPLHRATFYPHPKMGCCSIPEWSMGDSVWRMHLCSGVFILWTLSSRMRPMHFIFKCRTHPFLLKYGCCCCHLPFMLEWMLEISRTPSLERSPGSPPQPEGV